MAADEVRTDPRSREVLPADEGPLGMSWSIGRVLAVATLLVIVAFWAWVFSGAPKRQNPDFLDRTYASQLEQRCQRLRDDLAELPSGPTITDAATRAKVLDQANVLVGGFIDDVAADAPTAGHDAKPMAGWLADWRTYLHDREDYAKALRTDPDARLLLDASPLGDSVDETIEVFADVNEIDACATPGDVG